MTAFTDEDLKRLEFHVTGNRKDAFADGIYCRELEALLARLECAELCASQFSASFPNHAIAKAWRKAAGKEFENAK